MVFIFRPTQQPRKIHLERDTNEVVTAVQRYHHVTFNEFNEKVIGEPVPANNLRLSQSFGGADILFLPEEVKAIKRITEPGLKLLGINRQNETELCIILNNNYGANFSVK